MSIFPKSKVPQFKLRPDPIATVLFMLVFISGLLISLSFFKAEDGSGVYFEKGLISSIFTGLISLCLLFAATSKLLFSHLWKKNSSHDRHRMHSKNHPMEKEKAFKEKIRQK